MDIDIPHRLIDEAADRVADQKAEPADKIIVVIGAMWADIGNGKSKRARAAEAALPLGGVSVVGGILIALAQVFGIG